jgi:anaerobic selenocysteine-containing dehydrogenase
MALQRCGPEDTERLYADGRFWAQPDYCESYGKDLLTAAPLESTEYRSLNPTGKAVIKAAEYVPPHDGPDADHPFALTTGRTLYHFRTRTKTGLAPQLQAAQRCHPQTLRRRMRWANAMLKELSAQVLTF